MIIDSSAVIAILRAEPEAEQFAELIVSRPARISAANWLEASLVAYGQLGSVGCSLVDELIDEAEIEVEPVTAEQARSARLAFQRYGRVLWLFRQAQLRRLLRLCALLSNR